MAIRRWRPRLGVGAGGLAVTIGGIAGLISLVTLMAPAANAHALLVGSDPPAGGRLRGSSVPVMLRFSAAVDPERSSVMAAASGAAPVELIGLRHAGSDATTLVGAVPSSLPQGPFKLLWRAVATDDGHVSTGELTIVLGAGTSSRPSKLEPGPSVRGQPAGVAGAAAVVRTLGYLALALLCGGLAFLAVLWPAGAEVVRARAVLMAAWAVSLGTTVLGAGLEGASIEQRGPSAALSPGVIAHVLPSSSGRLWLARFLLLVLVGPILRALVTSGASAARAPWWRTASASVAVGLLRVTGLAGHATESRYALLGSAADLVHLVGISLWLGGLAFLCLVVLPRRQLDELAMIIPRYSTLALWSVAALSAAGVFMAWQLTGSVHAVVATRFGHLLLLKLAVFGVVLVVARTSQRWVRHRLDLAVLLRGTGGTVRPFVVSVATEAALAVAVLTFASALVANSPAR